MGAAEPRQCGMEEPSTGIGNQVDIHPRPAKTVIPVLDTRSGKFTGIAMDIEARGFEGDFECKWEKLDADGENCFPSKRLEFNISIRVTFNAAAG